jgi:hypothetical protein
MFQDLWIKHRAWVLDPIKANGADVTLGRLAG